MNVPVRFLLILVGLMPALTGEDLLRLENIPVRTRLSGEVLLINDRERMGTGGLHEDVFLLDSLPGFYVGLGGFGAVTGQRGGFFILGGTLGWTTPSWHGLGLDVGGFAGGGGGASSAGQGDGLMLRAHGMLSLGIPGGALQAGLAHTDFPGGDITSTSFVGGLVISDVFTVATLDPLASGSGGILDRRRWGIAPLVMRYRLDDDLDGRDGAPLGPHLDLVGIEFIRSWDERWSTPVMLGGALGGNRAGYMEVFSGLAFAVGDRWRAEARALAGLGGGGSLDTGGGIMLRPELALGRRFGEHWQLEARGGRAWAVEGDFGAWMGAVALRWHPEQWHLRSDSGSQMASIPVEAVHLDSWRLSLANTTYQFRNDEHVDLQLVDLALEKPLTTWCAVVGRTRSAYGGDAGGYSEGLFGIRGEVLLLSRFQLGVEADIGAGGGGGIPTGNGLITMLAGELRWQIVPKLALRLGYGRVSAVEDELSVDAVTIGVVTEFARALVR